MTLTGSEGAGRNVAANRWIRATQVGPQAREDLRDSLHRQVEESVKRGAKLLLGGEIPAGQGAFYPPTLLTAVEKGMPAFDEETFGPVAAVIRATNETDAVRLANDSTSGLGASLWTRDRERAERLAAAIEAGSDGRELKRLAVSSPDA